MQNNTYKLLDRNAAADYLGISATALDRLTRKGYIAYIEAPSSGKVGRPTRKWTIGDLNEFINSRRRRVTPPTTTVPRPRRRKSSAAVDLQNSSAADILAMGKGGA